MSLDELRAHLERARAAGERAVTVTTEVRGNAALVRVVTGLYGLRVGTAPDGRALVDVDVADIEQWVARHAR